jgi:predicted metalloprotease
MRWEDYRQSDNFEDRRGQAGGLGGGGGFRIPGGRGGGLGIGGLIIVGVLALVFGVDPRIILGGMEMAGGPPSQTSAPPSRGREGPSTDQSARFVRSTLAMAEDVWTPIFQQSGRRYQAPTLVLYDGRGTTTACGFGQPAMGPFYCPGDRRIYLDTSFFDQLARRFGAPGDFAAAYVIAHEVGHHVQNSLGLLQASQEARARTSQAEANRISVGTELQADCFAGVFAFHARDRLRVLQEGDIEEGMKAASAVGDDTIQRRSQGRVVPDSFTHGSSAQRVAAFKRGLERGRPGDCST